jgi:subtilisin family serine protease
MKKGEEPMDLDPSMEQFIDSPETVDFLLRKNEYLMDYLQSNPDVVLTQTIGGRYVVGYVNSNKYSDTIIRYFGASFVNAENLIYGLLDMRSLEAAGIYQVQQQPYLNLKGKGVLIGFVDTGIDYTKDTFRYEDGTSKIQYIYDQTVRGNTPEGFYIGTEYNNSQINEALKSENPFEIVPQKDAVGHGTFLASVAAGRADTGGFTGAAPDAELIIVKLRQIKPFYRQRFRTSEQVNAYGHIDIMIGIEYILHKARELGRPVAICLALGTNQGGHDGTSRFEEYLTGISNLRGVCVCTAAGNESLARHHFQSVLTAVGEEQNIDIRVGENAGDFSVSIRNRAADQISVSVRSPSGELAARVPARSGVITESKLVLENARIIIEYFFPLELSGSQLTIVRIVNATPGIWTIIVHGDIVLDGTYHAWLPLTGFVSPSVGFFAPTPYTTVVVPATAAAIITCGAYNAGTNSLYINSSWGPTRISALTPDLVAPGVNVGGVYPDGYGTMSGTSVAAAITTGASALMLQWGIVNKNDISMSTYDIRAYFIRGCSRIQTISYPNVQWGYGSLNLIETFNLMREV